MSELHFIWYALFWSVIYLDFFLPIGIKAIVVLHRQTVISIRSLKCNPSKYIVRLGLHRIFLNDLFSIQISKSSWNLAIAIGTVWSSDLYTLLMQYGVKFTSQRIKSVFKNRWTKLQRYSDFLHTLSCCAAFFS